MNTWSLVALLVTLALGPSLGWLLTRWLVRRAVMRAVEHLTLVNAELRVQLDHARETTSNFQEVVQTVTRERDKWSKLYFDQSIGHGNAQNLMMGQIERMVRLCKQKGIAVELPPVLNEVRAEYYSTHEKPAREAEVAKSDIKSAP